jgi:hypothetical protein
MNVAETKRQKGLMTSKENLNTDNVSRSTKHMSMEHKTSHEDGLKSGTSYTRDKMGHDMAGESYLDSEMV